MIIVSPLHAVPGLVELHKVTHVMSLLGPEMTPPTLPLGRGRHLRLGLHDINGPLEGLVHPEPHHLEKVLEFVAGWDRSGPMLIHCYAGISRSTAAAFTAMCALAPMADEAELARELRGHFPVASPQFAHGGARRSDCLAVTAAWLPRSVRSAAVPRRSRVSNVFWPLRPA